MTYTIQTDIFAHLDEAYLYVRSDEVIVAATVVVSAADSASIVCNFNFSRLTNYGEVIGFGLDVDGAGAWFRGDDCSILNAAGASISGIDWGAVIFGDRMVLANHGTTKGIRDAGVVFEQTADGGRLDNSGLIIGRKSGVTYSGGAGVIDNAGAIEGVTYGVLFDRTSSAATGALRIVNAADGVVTGSTASILAIGGQGVVIENHGTLIGTVHLGFCTATSTVINRGSIHGAVIFGSGNDDYRGAGGKAGAVNGGNGDDTLDGGPFGDRLIGGAGADIITGHGGHDQFIFDAPLNAATNTDIIVDFTPNVDLIVLANAGQIFPAAGAPGLLAAARFHAGAAAADASDRIIYNPNTGALSYDHDGHGGDAQVQFAELARHLALDHADFLIRN